MQPVGVAQVDRDAVGRGEEDVGPLVAVDVAHQAQIGKERAGAGEDGALAEHRLPGQLGRTGGARRGPGFMRSTESPSSVIATTGSPGGPASTVRIDVSIGRATDPGPKPPSGRPGKTRISRRSTRDGMTVRTSTSPSTSSIVVDSSISIWLHRV